MYMYVDIYIYIYMYVCIYIYIYIYIYTYICKAEDMQSTAEDLHHEAAGDIGEAILLIVIIGYSTNSNTRLFYS